VPRRKVLAGLVLAAGSVAGSVLYRRRAARRRERVDLYYEDGSMVSVADGPELERLLPLTREVLHAAGS
jgi:hypothetical protein